MGLEALSPPADSIGYKVVVVPHAKTRSCWQFAVLIPKDDKPHAIDLIRSLCEVILEPDDTFQIFTIGADIQDDLDAGMSVLSYSNDDPDMFDWIIPPQHVCH